MIFGEFMSQKKVTNRQIQAEETKNRIYSAAIKLMDKKGFDGMTIMDIVKAAGISVGAFYHYFTTKHDILAEIFHRADIYFSTVVAQKLRASRDSPRRKSSLILIVMWISTLAPVSRRCSSSTLLRLNSSSRKADRCRPCSKN